MKERVKSNKNIKQIITLIFFIIIIVIGIYATNNYKDNENSINKQPVISYNPCSV